MHAHTFIPVNGSVPLWALADPLEPDDVDVPLASDDGAAESDELLVEGELLEPDEADELPLEEDGVVAGDDEVFVVVASGSVYWLSPAEVLVPAASTAAAPPKETAASTATPATTRTIRRTPGIEPGPAVGQRAGWTMCPARTVAARAEKTLPPATRTCE